VPSDPGQQSKDTLVPKKKTRSNQVKGERNHRVSMTGQMVEYEEDLPSPLWLQFLRFCLGVVLLLPCVAVTLHIINQFNLAEPTVAFHAKTPAFFFGIGLLFCILIHLVPVFRELLIKPYVWGHEATHAIFVFLCYGRVSEFDSSTDGGYIIANRDNILVALSPYIFPIWMAAVGILYVLLGCFLEVSTFIQYFYLLCGTTWAFNLVWTVLMIPLGQSDLRNNGTFFSLTVIYLVNVLFLSLLLKVTLQEPGNYFDWLFQLVNSHLDVIQLLVR